ncbi:MAG TPA: CRISPR-associated endonuclease Cas3'' [Isosphaeraceae bacterium]|jgi:CRISPR-associated endonuclease/helicase Cas3|nr:CRISPR-associated endonuclease Cas3'' [Isosphaeraceae bacterium]
MDRAYAHSREGKAVEEWHPLDEHLFDTSALAAKFAAAFGSGPWGALAGLWHDIGKYQPAFQERLIKSSNDSIMLDDDDGHGRSAKVPHAPAGAIHVNEVCRRASRKLGAADGPLAMIIAGHHSGLNRNPSDFSAQILKNEDHLRSLNDAIRGGAPRDILEQALPDLPPLFRFMPQEDKDERKLRVEFWTRMLFSALIDADRLDTERAMDARRFQLREQAAARRASLGQLRTQLEAHLLRLAVEKGTKLDEIQDDDARTRAASVLDLRAEVLDACRTKALLPRGRFSLTVPTGGGKTLASLAFALDHAIKHELCRVIVVIPFTSIIDQTASVFRDVFESLGRTGKAAIIEHHSNLDPVRETVRNRLASENWDAPIVVTTSVQFFESLFTNRTTTARKLHNIARSVLVFDEVQTLPHHLRAPIFDGLNQLVDHYGCSALCCTATQPALSLKQVGREAFPYLKDVTEIIFDVPKAFATVAHRVKVEFPASEESTTWEQLSALIREHERVLAIVHKRNDARDLWRLLPEDTFHLSALMCSAHRKQVLDEIRLELKGNKPCRVVSTTLVEAGVDLDFPAVFRALGGADAMAQAAGRCNREGKLTDPGRLILFRAPSKPPKGLERGLEATKILLGKDKWLDLFNPNTYNEYFRTFFSGLMPDGLDIMRARIELDFPEVAQKFHMIEEEGQVAVVVQFGDAADRVQRFRTYPSRRTLRALQPFVVNAPQRSYEMFVAAGRIEPIHDQIQWLAYGEQYDARFGLKIDEIAPRNPAGLISE